MATKKNKKRTSSGWNAEQAFEKWKSSFTKIKGIPLPSYTSEAEITIDDWYNAQVIAARLVKRLGTEFLPVYQRVLSEIENCKKEQSIMDEINHIVNKSIDGKSNSIHP